MIDRKTHPRCHWDGKLIFNSQEEAREAGREISAEIGHPLYVYRRHKVWHLTSQPPASRKAEIQARNRRKNTYRRIAWGLRRVRDNNLRRN